MDLTTLFCDVDDFCKENSGENEKARLRLSHGKCYRDRKKRLSPSEIMTIMIYFHISGYRNFKTFYLNHVCVYLSDMFPKLLSYNRFVEIMPSVLLPLCCYLTSRLDKPSDISYIDSTKLEVCGKKRISRNKVFADVGKLGKTTMGWFFGFKLHLIINEQGGLVAVKITPGNVDDRTYVSAELFEELMARGLQLITNLKKNMKNKLMPLIDKILLRKRSIIETVNDQLKNISQIEHTRHRSLFNFMNNIICGLIAYTFRDKKPSIQGVEPLYQNTQQLIIA